MSPPRLDFDDTGDIVVKGRRLGNSSATVGGFSVSVRQISQRELRLTPPLFPDSFFDKATCSDGTEVLVPTGADVTITNDDTTCADTFTVAITVDPDDTKTACP